MINVHQKVNKELILEAVKVVRKMQDDFIKIERELYDIKNNSASFKDGEWEDADDSLKDLSEYESDIQTILDKLQDCIWFTL